MKKLHILLVVINLILVLAFVNYTSFQKEELLENGELLLFELAPVDPRSLIQGDYMSLRYAIADDIQDTLVPKRGFLVVKRNADGIAERVRIQPDEKPLNPEEFLVKYSAPNAWTLNIGAESFFFQEGQAARYETAKFGAIKVDNKGNSLLVGLYDGDNNYIRER